MPCDRQTQLWPPPDILCSITNHAQQAYPQECCGAWSIDSLKKQQLHPLKNRLPYPENQKGFLIDTLEWLALLEQQDQNKFSLQGIYHSHPNAPPILSKTDRKALLFEEQPTYPELFHLIVGISPSSAESFALYQWDPQQSDFQPIPPTCQCHICYQKNRGCLNQKCRWHRA